MNGLEAAIKSALSRSDRTNAEMRARIYQSARQALETGLRKQNINDPNVLAEQRHRLEALIHSIEQQERANLAAAAAAAQAAAPVPGVRREPSMEVPAPQPVPPPPADTSLRAERDIRQPQAAAAEPEADLGGMRAERDEWLTGTNRIPAATAANDTADMREASMDMRPEKIVRQRKPRRRLLSRLFITLVLLASVGTAGWWVLTSGLLLTLAERDTSVPNPPPRAEAEDFNGAPTLDPQQSFSADWISVFEPKQATDITAHEDAVVEAVSASDGNAVRIVSKSADGDGDVEIAVPVSVMRDMAGKTSTIALTMQAAGDKPVQISVDCDFDLLGSCARHRFMVNPEKSDVLLRVAFEPALAPSKPGTLILNGDIGGTGLPVNLYSVRILPGQ